MGPRVTIFCDRVWSFFADSLGSDGAYISIVSQLSALTDLTRSISDIEDSVNFYMNEVGRYLYFYP